MSTIASPRPSITLSSRRTSTSTEPTARSSSTTRAPQHQRRNRAALREFYNLKNSEPQSTTTTSTETLHPPDLPTESELDTPTFNASSYVSSLLAHESLEAILRIEASLLSDIRGFDGERKALVYDNHSKLIAATDTIRRMRANMEPLAPTTDTLKPAVAHIAGVARGLEGGEEEEDGRERERETVRWVLDAPGRLRRYLEEGKREDAMVEFERVNRLLDRWGGVEGVEDLRKSCKEILEPAVEDSNAS
ncbi:hypothetical protein MBLNU457_g2703t1 [Dothideomycetes sp. NU457]